MIHAASYLLVAIVVSRYSGYFSVIYNFYNS